MAGPRASPRTPRGSPTRRERLDRGRAQRPPSRASRLRPGRARQHRRRPRPGALRTTRCSRCAWPTASAGPGSCSATAAARSGSSPRSTPPVTRRRPRDRASGLAARGLDRGVDRSPRARPRAHRRCQPSWRRRSATSSCRRGACYHLAYVVSHDGDFARGSRADRSQPRALRRAGPALGPGRERALRRCGPRSRPSTASAPRAARDEVERWLANGRRPVAARAPRGDARRARAARAPLRRRRRTTSVARRRPRDGSASCRPRPTRSPASGARSARRATTRPARRRWQRAIEKAEATGDVRLAALAPRASRAGPACARPAAAGADRARGGGRVAPRRRRRRAGRARRVPPGGARRRGRRRRRRAAARRDPRPARERDGDAAVEVFALDALARIAAERGDGAPHESSARRRTGAWRRPRTSSPTATGPTRARSGRSPERDRRPSSRRLARASRAGAARRTRAARR